MGRGNRFAIAICAVALLGAPAALANNQADAIALESADAGPAKELLESADAGPAKELLESADAGPVKELFKPEPEPEPLLTTEPPRVLPPSSYWNKEGAASGSASDDTSGTSGTSGPVDLGWAIGSMALAAGIQAVGYVLIAYSYSAVADPSSYGDMSATAGPIYLGVTPVLSSLGFRGLADMSGTYGTQLGPLLVGAYIGALLSMGWGALYLSELYEEGQYIGPRASTSLIILPVLLPVIGETIAYFATRKSRR